MQQEIQEKHHNHPQLVSRHRRATPFMPGPALTEQDLALINRYAQTTLSADQVYVRSMYLCSDQPCDSDGCQFTLNALQQIAAMIAGQSVLSGHNRASLPLARFFKAEVIQRFDEETSQPVHYVQAWFYWLRQTSGAKDLLLNIDGGIYREVSLAWRYKQWQCSICNAERGNCRHRVGQEYEDKRCYRLITDVLDVLEGSLVYKGADRNTHLMGMHSERMLQENETVLLICDDDDPSLELFTNEQREQCAIDLNKIDDEFKESVELLWLKDGPEELLRDAACRFLINGGLCLHENSGQSSLYLFHDGELVPHATMVEV